MILGRMTRAFDNRQGIQDPRVSRQHLRLILAQGEAHEPNGVCRVQALGHNPSTIRRGKLATLGLGFQMEPPTFKLRRGDVTSLYPGDVIQLVCEDVSRAHGRSLPYEGNACAYQVCYLAESDDGFPPGTVRAAATPPRAGAITARGHGRSRARAVWQVVLGREAEETDEEGSSAGESVPEGGTTQQPAPPL